MHGKTTQDRGGWVPAHQFLSQIKKQVPWHRMQCCNAITSWRRKWGKRFLQPCKELPPPGLQFLASVFKLKLARTIQLTPKQKPKYLPHGCDLYIPSFLPSFLPLLDRRGEWLHVLAKVQGLSTFTRKWCSIATTHSRTSIELFLNRSIPSTSDFMLQCHQFLMMLQVRNWFPVTLNYHLCHKSFHLLLQFLASVSKLKPIKDNTTTETKTRA